MIITHDELSRQAAVGMERSIPCADDELTRHRLLGTLFFISLIKMLLKLSCKQNIEVKVKMKAWQNRV